MGGSLSTKVRKAVTDGLAARFDSLPGFNALEDEVDVRYAYSFGAQVAQQVYTGRSRADTDGGPLRSGRNVRTEVGTFEIVVRVELPGCDPEEADERVDEIGTVIEEWISDRKGDQLGIGLTSLRVTSWAGDYYGVDGGSGSIRSYTVTWVARIA